MLKERKELVSSFITDIVEDKQGYVWVATTNGLTRFASDLSKFKFYTKQNKNIHFDRKSALWLNKLSKDNKVFYNPHN